MYNRQKIFSAACLTCLNKDMCIYLFIQYLNLLLFLPLLRCAQGVNGASYDHEVVSTVWIKD